MVIRRSRFDPRQVQQYSIIEIDHEILSTVIHSLSLIQNGYLSVSGENKRAQVLLNRLED